MEPKPVTDAPWGRSPAADQLPRTSWTLIGLASGAGADFGAAREEFARRYYLAVRAYIAAVVGSDSDADDLVQGFFEEAVLSGKLLSSADRHKGQFRSFLKASIRHYLVDVHRRGARKRAKGPGQEVRPDALEEGWSGVAAETAPGADDELLRGWAQGLVGLALERVRHVSTEHGQLEHFQLFANRYLADPDNPPSWREVGKRFGLGEKIARSRAETVANRFREILRELILMDLGTEHDPEEEIRALIGLL